MICDRAATAQTCEAVQFDGANVQALRSFIGYDDAIRYVYGRFTLVTPDEASFVFLDVGDWIVKGVGDGDFYVIRAAKFPQLWTPRS